MLRNLRELDDDQVYQNAEELARLQAPVPRARSASNTACAGRSKAPTASCCCQAPTRSRSSSASASSNTTRRCPRLPTRPRPGAGPVRNVAASMDACQCAARHSRSRPLTCPPVCLAGPAFRYRADSGGPRSRPTTASTAASACRFHTSVRNEYGGQGWWTDYPDADTNFLIRLVRADQDARQSGCRRHPESPRRPRRLAGTVQLSLRHHRGRGDRQIQRRRGRGAARVPSQGRIHLVRRLLGCAALESFEAELATILPATISVVDLTPEPIRSSGSCSRFEVPQIPSINHWRRSGGATSERGADSDHVNLRGIVDAHGRLMVLMTHNTDISDAWEREGEDQGFFYRFSPDGYAVGINVLLYALTH